MDMESQLDEDEYKRQQNVLWYTEDMIKVASTKEKNVREYAIG